MCDANKTDRPMPPFPGNEAFADTQGPLGLNDRRIIASEAQAGYAKECKASPCGDLFYSFLRQRRSELMRQREDIDQRVAVINTLLSLF